MYTAVSFVALVVAFLSIKDFDIRISFLRLSAAGDGSNMRGRIRIRLREKTIYLWWNVAFLSNIHFITLTCYDMSGFTIN